ncbi:50S ribosomal protein acetyltransferase [Azospirillum argentinense]|uniref:GNAT family N-acetyltransferase n=1 Tax=Azospirillum argentinense TaxID=2970906 RepID=UPI0032DFDAC3
MDPITTERLILRPFRNGDAPDLLAYLSQPRANCFLSLKLDGLDAAAAEVDARSRSDEHIAVCLRSSGRVIGDLFQMHEPPDTHSVGWNFNADFAGAGYATEAARAFFDHLFAARQARRLYAYVEETNTVSQRLCERLGMRKEGLFVEFISFTMDGDGNPLYENTMQYALLRKEWRA